MRTVTFLLAVLLAVAPMSGSADEGDRYSNQQLGLAVEKPRAWHFVSVQSMVANRQRVRFKDEELGEIIRQRARQPLVVIAKYEDPVLPPDVIPTAQILLSPLGALRGEPPEKALEAAMQHVHLAFPDFRLVKPVHATTVAGLPAAHVVADYRLVSEEGASSPVRARTWLVPRGAFAFVISMSGPQHGADVSEEEFAGILKSIVIEE